MKIQDTKVGEQLFFFPTDMPAAENSFNADNSATDQNPPNPIGLCQTGKEEFVFLLSSHLWGRRCGCTGDVASH